MQIDCMKNKQMQSITALNLFYILFFLFGYNNIHKYIFYLNETKEKDNKK